MSERKDAERMQLRGELEDIARKRGFDIHDVMGGRGRGKARAKVAPKYRDPKNPENTWTGRGRMPRWMTAATRCQSPRMACRMKIRCA